MAEYIERDMFLKIISNKPSSPTTDREDRLINGFISAVKNCPAADVRPVVRGKWLLEYEPNGKPYCFHCSVCDGDFHYIGISTKYDFCPNCGAKMEES